MVTLSGRAQLTVKSTSDNTYLLGDNMYKRRQDWDRKYLIRSTKWIIIDKAELITSFQFDYGY